MPTTADQANQLAQFYSQLGQAVDQFRESNGDLSNDDINNLVALANQLRDISDHFNEEAVLATLAQVQDSVNKILAATKDAQQAIKNINKVQNVFTIASDAVALGAAFVSGNVGTIASSSATLFQAVSTATGGGGTN
jgi:hypothetical protein